MPVETKSSMEMNAEKHFSSIFWGDSGFEDLRRYTKQSSDFFREIIAILEERAELEDNYGRGLQKLGNRLSKITQQTIGNLDSCWNQCADEMDAQSAVHRGLAASLQEEVVRPLNAVFESQLKTKKAIEGTVEKFAKKLADKRNEQLKSKKNSHNLAKECEKVEKECDEERRRSVRSMNEKQAAKLQTKRLKLQDQSIQADLFYHDFCIEAEIFRQNLEAGICGASLRLELMEEQRLANLKTALGRYRRNISQIGPKLSQLCNERLTNNFEEIDIKTDMQMIMARCKQTKCPHRVLVLCDFFAEDFTNVFCPDRRKEILERYHLFFEKDLQKEHKHKDGLAHMSKIYDSSPRFHSEETKQTVKEKLRDSNQMLHFLEFHLFKLQCAMAQLSNVQKPMNVLARYSERYKDKANLRQTILKIPIFACDDISNMSPAHSVTTLDLIREAADGASPDSSSHPDETESVYERVEEENAANLDKERISAEGSDSFSSPRTKGEPQGTKNGPQVTKGGPGTCTVLYAYKHQRKDELDLSEGQVIRVIEKLSDDWWRGEVEGRIGLFPTNYVEEM